MRIHKNIPKRILCLCLVFAIGISMGVLSDHFVSENSRFQTFTEKLFRSEVCSNTLTLHYTLAHPEKKGIRKPEATLGTALSDPAKTTSLCQEYEKELKSFAYSRLSEENRLTCDMLLLYFHTRASLGKNSALDEPLGPGLGVQAQLPILLAEYTFRTKEDISDYLKLLSTVRPYFQSIIKLEKQKSQSGLFMSDTTLDRILKQCHSFVANPDSNYMDDIFAQKLKAFSNPAFSSEDQKKLCTYHHKLILTEVIPAYQKLADSLESLRGTGKSSRGLAFFEGGREYYLYLLQSQTGTYVPVGQIEKRLSAQLLSDYREISSLLKQNSSLIDRLNQCSGELTLTPTQMLEKLPELMKKDFPELKDATYELRTVHPSMKKFLSPAFYLTPPAKPNAAHAALAKLEAQGKLTAVVTQNIDGLHQLAGSKNVYELHGSIHRNHCMRCNRFFDAEYVKNHSGIPYCPCGGMIKPDVVLYEESLDPDVLAGAVAHISRADMLIVGGTSLQVYPAAGLINYYSGNKLVLINKTITPYDSYANLVINDSIGKVLSAAVE